MSEVTEDNYMYEDILTLIKYIHGLWQAASFWFKEYIKPTTLKAGLKQWNTDPCILYRVNEHGDLIFIVYVYDTLEFIDKLALDNMI